MKIHTVLARFTFLLLSAVSSLTRMDDDPERGDVPGWVMITLMSAVLVAALLAIAGPALEGLFNQAIDQVSP
jgi:L-cystine uptake protein TcyP (sodium:dicarboxylate symporter family)